MYDAMYDVIIALGSV